MVKLSLSVVGLHVNLANDETISLSLGTYVTSRLDSSALSQPEQGHREGFE